MSDFLKAWDQAIMEARVLGEQRPVWCIQTTTKGEMGVFMAARTMHPSFMAVAPIPKYDPDRDGTEA